MYELTCFFIAIDIHTESLAYGWYFPKVIVYYFLTCVKEYHGEIKLLLLIVCDNNRI